MKRTVLKRKVASVAVEAMEGVVQIHIPRLKLKNHTIGDQQHIEDDRLLSHKIQ